MTKPVARPRWWRRLGRAQEGASVAEFAFIFPVFLVILLGIFEFARAYWAVNTLQYAVSQGTRYAIVHRPAASACCPSTGTPACPSSYTTDMSSKIVPALGLSGVTLTPTVGTLVCTTSPPTVQVTVQATYSFNFLLSGSVGSWAGTIPLKQKATVTTPLS